MEHIYKNKNPIIKSWLKYKNDGSDNHIKIIDEKDYDLIFSDIFQFLKSNSINEILDALYGLNDVLDINFNFFNLIIRYQLIDFLIHLLNKPTNIEILNAALKTVNKMISYYSETEIATKFLEMNLVGILNKIIIDKINYFDEDDITVLIHIIEAFKLLASISIKARNLILKTLDFSIIQTICLSNDQQISYHGYDLIIKLCTFAITRENCDVFLTFLINGIYMDQKSIFDKIFEAILSISYVQEKYWYELFREKQGEKILIQYLNIYPVLILNIMQRIVDTSNELSNDILKTVILFVNSTDDLECSAIISKIFKKCIENKISIKKILDFDMIDSLIQIAHNGNFYAKENAIYCLSELYLYNNKEIIDILHHKHIIDLIIGILESNNNEYVLYALIVLIKIIEYSINQGFFNIIKDNIQQIDFLNIVNSLSENEDTLIQEHSEYLYKLIMSSIE